MLEEPDVLKTVPERMELPKGADSGSADVAGREVVKLYRPIHIDGKEVREVVLDFDCLSGDDLENVEQELMTHKRVTIGGPALSQTFNMYVAARAANINVRDLKRMSIRDATRITMLTQNFLMKSESDEDETSGA